MLIKLTASEISGYLKYPLRIGAFTPPRLQQAIAKGRLVHSRLGYSNSRKFSRYMPWGKDKLLIVGIPDRIDDDFVYELKTFHTKKAYEKNIEVGRIQAMVYGFLTGLPAKVVMYDVEKDEFAKGLDVPFNAKEFRKIITKALKLKRLIIDFREKFKKIQGGD